MSRPTFRIRTASVDDAWRIAGIHVASWRKAYSGIIPDEHIARQTVGRRFDNWREALQNGAQVLLAETGGIVVGWAAFENDRDEPQDPAAYEITAIYVDPNFWFRGAGTALVEHVCERLAPLGARDLRVHVLERNAPAVRFYRSLGFRLRARKTIERGGQPLDELKLGRALAPSRH